jgi:hypothetical protein
MPKEIYHSSQSTIIPEALLATLFQNTTKQQLQEEQIAQLNKENAQLKNVVLTQRDACRQYGEWLTSTQKQNSVLHNYLNVLIEEGNLAREQLNLLTRFLYNLKNWLNITTFANHFPSQRTQCIQVDKLLFDKVLTPRLLAVTSPTKLSTTEAMSLLKELQQANPVLKDKVRSKYADKVWLVLSKLLYPPHSSNGLLSKFQFFETFCKDFWAKEKPNFATHTHVSRRLNKAIHTTQCRLLAMQEENTKDLVTAILEFITQHFNVATIVVDDPR